MVFITRPSSTCSTCTQHPQHRQLCTASQTTDPEQKAHVYKPDLPQPTTPCTATAGGWPQKESYVNMSQPCHTQCAACRSDVVASAAPQHSTAQRWKGNAWGLPPVSCRTRKAAMAATLAQRVGRGSCAAPTCSRTRSCHQPSLWNDEGWTTMRDACPARVV